MEILQKVIKQTGWQLFGKLVTVATTLFILSTISRSYGKEGVGIYTLVTTYIYFFYLAVDLGLNGVLLPKFSQDHSLINKLFNLRVYWSFIMAFLAIGLSFFLPFTTPLFVQGVAFSALTVVSYALSNSFNVVFQYKLRFDQFIVASSAGALLSLPFFLFLSSQQVSVSFLILPYLLGWLINNLTAYVLVRKYQDFKISAFPTQFVKKTIPIAWPISLTLLLNTIYFRLDAFILSSLTSFADVGVYNIAYSVFQNALTVPTFIMNSYYPLMAKSFLENRLKFFKQLKLAAVLLVGVSVLGTMLTLFLSPLVISIIAGDGFEGSTTALRILSFGFPAYFLSALFMWYLILQEKYKTLLLIYISGLILSTVLNLMFISKYSYIASSYITGITEYFILLLQLVVITRLK